MNDSCTLVHQTPAENGLVEHTPPTARIEAFSDAVIAIILTLLVLELHIPVFDYGATNGEILSELLHLWPKFGSFAGSFVILCIFWVNHHQFFHALDHSDGKILWHNNHLLFWLCLIPFTSGMLGENHMSAIPVAFSGFVLFMAAVAFFLMGRYAFLQSHLVHDVPDQLRAMQSNRSLFGVVAYGLSVPLAFLSVYLSLAIFVLVPIFYFVPRRIFKAVMG